MPTQADDPLRKVTLNLYAADCEFMERIHGTGWTTRIREIIHARVLDTTAIRPANRTLGDLE